MKKFAWLVFMLAASLCWAMKGPADTSAEAPWTVYEMKLVQIRDAAGSPCAYVIGYSAFQTVQGLKDWVAQIPEGNTLRWDSGSDIPIPGDPLGNPEAAEDFRKFCEARKINLEEVPRP
ncbi:MAG: hypothetical protein Q8Q08_01035 [Candidatus Omnitrophota bacterium]|nr:hypothetical protein [Candidatus Omnitrophota bacterium]MDZ4241259.1 hypothetical protein [Candidatus Omnitrophota bacterium]